MLYTYSIDSQTISANGNIPLNVNGITNRCDGIIHDAGAPAITLNRAGTYLVTVNLDATSATTGTSSFSLYNNGVAVKGAIATTTVATANNIDTYSFTAVVRILPSCPAINNIGQLTVVNTGANAAIVSNIAVTVKAI